MLSPVAGSNTRREELSISIWLSTAITPPPPLQEDDDAKLQKRAETALNEPTASIKNKDVSTLVLSSRVIPSVCTHKSGKVGYVMLTENEASGRASDCGTPTLEAEEDHHFRATRRARRLQGSPVAASPRKIDRRGPV